ncbi:MAG: hypothetical protein HY868_10645 [Chloroflexi bacterium]|nr:hypothetical protein [Chloroflexota bacterium]
MTTRKLLWGMTWRGGVWGLVCGGLLGGGYSVVLLGLLYMGYVINAFLFSDFDYLFYVLTDATLAALPTMLVSFFLGSPVGGVAGATVGCVIGIFTRILFYPSEDEKRFQLSIRVLGDVAAIIATFLSLGFAITRSSEGLALNDALITAFIAFIAGQTIILVQKPTTAWFVDEMHKTIDFKKKIEFQSRLTPWESN